jgi:hypothetical protein
MSPFPVLAELLAWVLAQKRSLEPAAAMPENLGAEFAVQAGE